MCSQVGTYMGYEYEPLEPPHDDHEERWWFIPRITPRPAPTVPVDDATDSVCIRISRAWVPHIAGYIEGLTWSTAWTGTESERIFARNQANKLMALLMTGSENCGDVEAMDCQDVQDCIEPQQQLIIAQQFNANRTLWQQMPAVTDIQDAYDQGGATAVDPDATGLFRRDNTGMERHISIAAIYVTAHKWQTAQLNKHRAQALPGALAIAISPVFIPLGLLLPAATGLLGLVDFVDVLPAMEALSNFDALQDVIASSWISMEDQPETFTGWQTGAQSTYYVDTPEEEALRDILASDFFTDERNFIAYLAIRQQISDRVYNGGQPFPGRGRHWFDNNLVGNAYTEWLLERSTSTSWFGIEMLQGTFDTEPAAVSDGSHYHVEFKIEFGRVVNVTGIWADHARTHTGGTFLGLQNIRRIRLYNGDTLQWELEYTSNGILSFPALDAGRGNGFDATRVEVYARAAASKTSDLRVTRLRVAGEHFPPTRFWI